MIDWSHQGAILNFPIAPLYWNRYILTTWRLVTHAFLLATWRLDLHEREIHGKEVPTTWALVVVNWVDDFKFARLAM